MPTRLGIVGSGQLARMIGQAAIGLAVECVVFADRPDEATAGWLECRGIGQIAAATDLAALTFEHELTPLADVRAFEAGPVPVRPGADVLALADKAAQRQRFATLGLPVPRFVITTDGASIRRFGAEFGWPVVVKPATGGYDGRGVFIVGPSDPVAPFAGSLVVVEEHVAIERELAVVVARRPGGETVVYPVVETVQRDGMCREVIVPAPVEPALAAEAEQLGDAVAHAIGAVGVVAIELFVAGGHVLINEIAPRVHNSGHFSIEGADTSQFENHIRAVLDWPLGPTALRAPYAVMVNVVGSAAGDPRERVADALGIPGAHIHLYGKSWREGRKLGHVTVLGSDLASVRERAHAAVAALGGQPMDGGVPAT